jgi:uncharacterized protein YlxP (DUF503 family)
VSDRILYRCHREDSVPGSATIRNQRRVSNVSSEKTICEIQPSTTARGGPRLAVHIGACVITLRLHASNSLKDKRQVVRSLSDRLRRQFNVAVAEVEDQDQWQSAVLGLAVVSNDVAHATRMLERILEVIEETRLDAELVDRQIDVMSL